MAYNVTMPSPGNIFILYPFVGEKKVAYAEFEVHR